MSHNSFKEQFEVLIAENTNVHCLLVLTMACDEEVESLSFSNERDENSGGVLTSIDLLA